MDDDDDRHKREEQERRAKRKASKLSKSDAQLEKDRKRKEYRQKILQEQGGVSIPSEQNKKRKAIEAPLKSSAFQDLFSTRAQGFQIDFRFRNAPPRPPVGPFFVGHSLDSILLENSKHYKPLNSVEVNYTWKLHSEPDLGVPLAPSAIDLKSYTIPQTEQGSSTDHLHPDDQALLNWKGSMGDTAADDLKKRQDKARADARLILSGRSPALANQPGTAQQQQQSRGAKKVFSRVLNEGMQSWMKKTTYLSNDYSRKVHDFKSLARTKQELAQDLKAKQEEMAKRRSVRSIQQSFGETPLVHPTKKNLKPKSVYSVLPNVKHWGRSFTHVVIDKAPQLPKEYSLADLSKGFVANVEKKGANARMTCQLFVPNALAQQEQGSSMQYRAVQAYDLDVIPLKEESAPHSNFCFWVDPGSGVATYLPISSRVQLSTGRPVTKVISRALERRSLTGEERQQLEERTAEVDRDLADKHASSLSRRATKEKPSETPQGVSKEDAKLNEVDDDGEGDFGADDDDDDSNEEQLFGGGTKTIVAEG